MERIKVHWAKWNAPLNRYSTYCGRWQDTAKITHNTTRVTCEACRRQIQIKKAWAEKAANQLPI